LLEDRVEAELEAGRVAEEDRAAGMGSAAEDLGGPSPLRGMVSEIENRYR